MALKNKVYGYIYIAVAVLLVVALVTGTILVCRTKEPEYVGELKASDVKPDAVVLYSPETETAFRIDIGTMLTNFLQSVCKNVEGLENEKPVINNSAYISKPLLKIFSNAAIPTDKLLAFGKYLAGIDSDQAVLDILDFILEVDETTGSAKFASPEKLAGILTGKVDLYVAVEDIVKHTSLTAEECARLVYELVLMCSDETAQTAAKTLGRSNFVTLVVSLTTVYDGYVAFNMKGGTKNEARLLGELLFGTGIEIERLIASVGMANIINALKVGKSDVVDNSKLKEFLRKSEWSDEDIVSVEMLGEAVDSATDLTEIVLYFAEKAFTSVGNETLEALANYTSGLNDGAEDERYLKLYYIGIANAISDGIANATEKSEPSKDAQSVVKAVAKLKLDTERFSANPPTDENGRLLELEEAFGKLYGSITAVSQRYGNVKTIEDYVALSEEGRTELDGHLDDMRSFDYGALTAGGKELVSVILVNVIFNALYGIVAGATASA